MVEDESREVVIEEDQDGNPWSWYYSLNVKSWMAPERSTWARWWCCEIKGFSGPRIKGSEESAKLKLDRGREESGICQEVDEYKTGGKVQLLCDTYTWYHTAYSK